MPTLFVDKGNATGVLRHLQCWLFDTPEQLAEIVVADLAQLRSAEVKPTEGDTRCIIFGAEAFFRGNARAPWVSPEMPKKTHNR